MVAVDYTARAVTLCDGSSRSLAGLDAEQLLQLQWEQEQAFAGAIIGARRRSPERQATIAAAYDFLGVVLSARAQLAGTRFERLKLGSNDACVDLVTQVLRRQVRRRRDVPSFFEVGYGTGAVISAIEQAGFPAGGIEVSSQLRQQALPWVSDATARRLLVGNLLDLEPGAFGERPSVIYWNDVMEHIAPDEVPDYLGKIHQLLAPGGSLVTVTPNWLGRPCDVTNAFHPPRTTARGLHLKEYTFGEVVTLLKLAGFARITGPLGAVRGRFIAGPVALTSLKRAVEPLLERSSLKTMRKWTTRLALSVSIAVKAG